MNDDGASVTCGAGGIRVLVFVCCLRERDQDAGCAADRQFTETSCSCSTDREVGMLEQARNFITKCSLRELGMAQLSDLRIIPACEVNHAAALLEKLRQDSVHHSVQSDSSLAAAHDNHERSCSGWHPIR